MHHLPAALTLFDVRSVRGQSPGHTWCDYMGYPHARACRRNAHSVYFRRRFLEKRIQKQDARIEREHLRKRQTGRSSTDLRQSIADTTDIGAIRDDRCGDLRLFDIEDPIHNTNPFPSASLEIGSGWPLRICVSLTALDVFLCLCGFWFSIQTPPKIHLFIPHNLRPPGSSREYGGVVT
jgi:hypothetical protein